ncbi:hypothetical protein HYZ80_01570 [Candidatus Parcubacteria bacterium]|nr:hypothetical protein [Candidatus Parcubacteria bacterium]
MTGYFKAGALIFLTTALFGVTWYLTERMLASARWQLAEWGWLLGFAAAYLLGAVLLCVLVRPVGLQAGAALLTAFVAVGITFWVHRQALSLVAVGAAAFFLCVWYAGAKTLRLADELVIARPRQLAAPSVPVLVTGFAILVGAASVTSPALSGFSESVIPRPIFDRVVAALPVQEIFPGFAPTMTVDDFVAASLGREGAKVLTKLSVAERKAFVKRGREDLSRQYGVELKGSERLGDVLYQVLSARLLTVVAPWRNYMPYLVALSFFFFVKLIGGAMGWAVRLAAPAAMGALISLKVVRQEFIDVKKEVLRLK